MKVSAQYAQEHFQELVSAAYNGEAVEIESPEKPSLKLVLSRASASSRPRAEIFGSARGKIKLVEDWDSPGVNEKIASEFENSDTYPR